jgi:hypothetical protein
VTSDEEQAERDLMGLQLDALLAILAVELAKEERANSTPPRREWRTRPPRRVEPVSPQWLKKAS